ncbi:hypothetical protein PAEPH01_0826 [Pancytospora epiphaga]|nr:hypothetical protein PAEPH01_0826 [Pancytospora epiphaga]
MIFKRWKLVYIIVSVKILVATWNTSSSHEENNIDMYDSEHYVQYNPVAPEYPRLQPYNNEMGTSGIYNGSAMRGSFNIAAPIYQNNSSAPNYPPLQQSYGNEMHGYNAYNNPMMLGSFNTEAPAYQYNPFPPAYPELQQPYRNEACNYNPYNNPIMGGLYNFGIPTSSEPEERVHQREIKTPDIEQLITEMRQTGQNLSSGVRLSEVEYNRRITEIINEQESAELNLLANNPERMPIKETINEQESGESNSSANNSEEMPIEETINEHRPYDMEEEFHSLVVPQSAEDSPYEYSNFVFLYHFLRSPSPLITADSIRVRFGAHFLSFLTSSQLIRVLIILLENKLELSNEDQKEFIETIFGHIDYSLELVITKEPVVKLVEAMMKSNVPDYFEYVFLTWKMWYSFTIEEQEKMLKDARREYKRETRMMLYLFVVNRDGINSQQCEIFKNDIKNQYKGIGISNKKYLLEDLILYWDDRKVGIFCTILDTFDTCLLDIPEVFKGFDNNTIFLFRNSFRKHFFPRQQNFELQVLNYKSHVCYTLTKFTRELGQVNDIGKSKDVETNSRLYFDPLRIKYEFATWIKMMKKNNSHSDTIITEVHEKGFINVFAIIRQLVQSDKYNHNVFFKIFNKVSFNHIPDKSYLTLLFSLTNKNILIDLEKTQEWIEYTQKRSISTHSYQFLEDIFINNVNPKSKTYLKYSTKICIMKIYESLSTLTKKRDRTMRREHYFYHRLLFHPRSSIFNGRSMLSYIEGLSKIGQFNNKGMCDQIARDLIFNEYYHENAIKLKKMSKDNLSNDPKLLEFKKSIEREYESYKNKGDIEKERENFRMC